MKDKHLHLKSKNPVSFFFSNLSPFTKAVLCGLFGAINLVVIHYHISYLNLCDSDYPAFIQISRGSSLAEPVGGELAVVHMGVHKTGSTMIQDMTMRYTSSMLKDGYEMPWTFFKRDGIHMKHVDQNQVTFSECFVPSGDILTDYSCVPELLFYGMEITKRQNNIFISAESFSAIDGEQIKNLGTYMSQWKKTQVIVYYRHYFDYLRSKGNQEYKNRNFSEKHLWEENLLTYLTQFSDFRYPAHTSALVGRLRPYFDDIVVVDYHDKSKPLVEQFFCDVLPNAKNTCKEVENVGEIETTNESVDMSYSNLAYAAMKKKLIEISNDEEMDEVTEKIKAYNEEIIGITTKDMKKKCLPEETLDALLNSSLELQLEVFPNANGDQLKEMFEEEKSKLCILDTDGTLEEGRWKTFFAEFKYSSQS